MFGFITILAYIESPFIKKNPQNGGKPNGLLEDFIEEWYILKGIFYQSSFETRNCLLVFPLHWSPSERMFQEPHFCSLLLVFNFCWSPYIFLLLNFSQVSCWHEQRIPRICGTCYREAGSHNRMRNQFNIKLLVCSILIKWYT